MLLDRHRIEKVQLLDMGSYRCAVQSDAHNTTSEAANILLEGEPTSGHQEDIQYIQAMSQTLLLQAQCDSQTYLEAVSTGNICLRPSLHI